MTGLISETYWRAPPLFFFAALLIGCTGVYNVVDAIRTGVFSLRSGAAYRDRHPVRFWFHVAMFFVASAAGLVLGAVGLGLWAWRTFGPAAPP
jgi:hypothetical protein